MTREDFKQFSDLNELLIADGFDDAIIGVARKFNSYSVLYDSSKCIDILMQDGSTYEEALDYFEYNVVGSYVGDKTPIFSDIIDE